MKLAVVISRSPTYRMYAPIIQAALDRGWSVECWRDYSQQQTGPKGYQFPWVGTVPTFSGRQPLVRSYAGQKELRDWLRRMQADAVLAWETVHAAAGEDIERPRPAWINLQYNLDSSCAYGPDELLACDVLALYSRWWLDWAGSYYEAEGRIAHANSFVQDATSRAAFVGIPGLDAASLIDPAEVRRRWRIPAGKPVVVLFLFPQGVGRTSFWPRRIHGEPSRLRQVANILTHRRFEYWPHVRQGWSDLSVVRAIRRFCDRNGALLLVKPRPKTPVPGYTKSLADLCLCDDSHYPATALEALSIASLSCMYYTTAVFESVSSGVPHLCVAFKAEDYLHQESCGPGYFTRFYSPAEGSPFQSRGLSTVRSTPEVLDELPGRTLEDFTIDEGRREQYIRTLLTHDRRDGSIQTVDAIGASLGLLRKGHQ